MWTLLVSLEIWDDEDAELEVIPNPNFLMVASFVHDKPKKKHGQGRCLRVKPGALSRIFVHMVGLSPKSSRLFRGL